MNFRAPLFALLALATLTIWCPERWILSTLEAALLALAAVWLTGCVVRRRPPLFGPSGGWLVAGAGWVTLLMVAGVSVYPSATLVEWIDCLTLLGVYLLGRQLFREADSRRRFLDWFLVFGSVTAVFSLVEYFTSEGKFLWVLDSGYPDLLGPFQNRNNFAAFVELLVPLAIWRAARARADRWLWIVVTAGLAAAVVASSSRAGSLIVGGEVFTTALLLWGRRLLSPLQLVRYVSALAAMLLTAGFVVGWASLLGRFSEANLLGHRAEIVESTFSMLASRPWTGFGPGTFQTVYPAFARFDIGLVVNHAHNDWLEWGAEGGLPLLLLMGLFVASHAKPAVGTIWGLGVIAVLAHALVDFPLQRLGVSGWVFLMMAAVAAARSKPPAPQLSASPTVPSPGA